MSTLIRLGAPLKKLRITQRFAENLLDYSQFGLKGHNGIDFSAGEGTPCYAAYGGTAYYRAGGKGYGNEIRIRNKDAGLEILYCHLSGPVEGLEQGKPIEVKRGDIIGYTGNTGWSTGPHLHFEVRRIYWLGTGAGPYTRDEKNGYGGAVDPMPLFDTDVFRLPVDTGYGLPPAKTELEWYKDAMWFWRKVGRLPTTREKLALLYGRWDIRTILDPALDDVWTMYSKMGWQQRKR